MRSASAMSRRVPPILKTTKGTALVGREGIEPSICCAQMPVSRFPAQPLCLLSYCPIKAGECPCYVFAFFFLVIISITTRNTTGMTESFNPRMIPSRYFSFQMDRVSCCVLPVLLGTVSTSA